MKSDITFLSERKQRDLHELVALIREEIRDVVMIILYGSYAKNTYVDLDERHDFGVRTYYMSDYDLLVVTQRRLWRYRPKDGGHTGKDEKSNE